MREKIFFVSCPRCGTAVGVYDVEFGTGICDECDFEFEVATTKSCAPNLKIEHTEHGPTPDFEKDLAAYLDMSTIEEPIMDKEKKYRAEFEIRSALSPKTNLVTAMQAVAMRSISLMREKGLVKDGERISIEIDGDVYTF